MEVGKGYFPTDPPPPPYPYSAGPPANTLTVSPLDPLTTQSAIAVSSLISQGGRASLFTLCPHCTTPVHTKNEYVPNQRVKTAGDRELRCILIRILCFAVFIVVSIVGYTIGFGVMTSDMPVELVLIFIGVFLIFFVFGMVMMCRNYFHLKNKIANSYHDVTHVCPICNRTLGVCDGYPFYEEDKRQRKFLAALRNLHIYYRF